MNFCLLLIALLPNLLTAAVYEVAIDYKHPTLVYTDTGSGIKISYYDKNGNRLHEETTAGIKPISEKPRVFRYVTSATVQKVTIEISGNDAFFIDRLTIRKNGSVLEEYGKDGGKGWCLSTDPNDSNGGWKNNLEGSCQPMHSFTLKEVEAVKEIPNPLGPQVATASRPSRQPSAQENNWVYGENEQRLEINAEGLGRCYDVRYLDPVNWSNETLLSGQRASVISLVRDDSKRPARHNNKDYVVPKGVIFTSEIVGDAEAESKFAATSFEYESEVLQEYRGKVGVPKAGSAKVSAAFRDVSQDAGSTSSLYVFSKMYKQFYKLDLYFDDPSHQHYVDPRFWQGVKELGHTLSPEAFIRKFGTHYASTAYYGGNFLQRRTVNQSQYSYYESNESEFKADVSGTIKKVNFQLGTTQGSRNGAGETETVEMSSAKIFTIGGDLNQYRPDLWAQSVLQNLAVIKGNLTRISELLTPKNFPEIPNIQAKKQLLETAIQKAEQEALIMQSDQIPNDFFTKKPARFKLTVTYLKCRGHGSKEPGTESEFFGKLNMGMFNQNGTALSAKSFLNRSKDKTLDLKINQSYNINKSLIYTVQARDIQRGYVSVYGSLKEKDLAIINELSNISHHAESAKIYFRNALDVEAKKSVTLSSKYGDKVVVYYNLRRL